MRRDMERINPDSPFRKGTCSPEYLQAIRDLQAEGPELSDWTFVAKGNILLLEEMARRAPA